MDKPKEDFSGISDGILSERRQAHAIAYHELRADNPREAGDSLKKMFAIDTELRIRSDRENTLREQEMESRPDTYKGQHEAPDHESGAPMHDLTAAGTYPADFYTGQATQYIDKTDARSMCMLGLINAVHQTKAVRPSRYAQVTVYRAIPKDVTAKIERGDWVTPSLVYAKEHGRDNLKNSFKVIQKTVRANELFTSGDSLLEWGYDPLEGRALAVVDAPQERADMQAVQDKDMHETDDEEGSAFRP